MSQGKPDESRLVELIRLDGNPRMPFKQDPLPKEKMAIVERWVTEGAKYDGNSPGEDWTILLRKTQEVTIPAAYPVTMPITALQFNRDGTAIAASGYHEITFWKTADGTLDRRLTGLAERIYDIAYSPDGKWLATASGDPGVYGIAKLWLAEPGGGGKPVRDLAETQDVVFAVAFSPDSKKIATAGADRTIRVFEVETGKLLTQIEDHADWIFGIAFSPDGKRLASASRDKTGQGLRPRKERIARDLSRAMHSRFTRSRSLPTAKVLPPAAKTTASGSGTRTTTANRSARSAASAARSSSCALRPTASTWSPLPATR